MKVDAPPKTLMRQAPATATEYMRKARDEIDQLFGDGYAAGHPELVAAFMKTTATDFATAILAQAFQGLSDAIQALAE